MVFVDKTMTESWIPTYGEQRVWSHVQPITHDDYQIIAGSQKHGRSHDITLYIESEGQIAVTAKHFYPPGMYRTPSGGLTPGEALEIGAGREATEETGLIVCLTRYLLRAEVVFTCSLGDIAWVSHIFRATTNDRTIAPTDHEEIREARWADLSEFPAFGVLMRQSDKGGLKYRASLHEQVALVHPLFTNAVSSPS